MGNNIKIFCSNNWKDYDLLDTGEGEKLERFGSYTFVRPYESAFWNKSLDKGDWSKIDGKFWSSKEGAKSGWKMINKIDSKWEMSYKGIKFWAWPTPFRHLGFFPEQASHWDLIEEKITKQQLFHGSHSNLGAVNESNLAYAEKSSTSQSSKVKFLNLFGYTGVASLFALRAGAEVTHIDASKVTLSKVKENQELSGLNDLPMRIILDDAIKFIDREIKRGNKYDCVIMDPPKFGRGPKGETWKIEKDLPELLSKVKKILSDKPLFVILTSYAIETSALSLGYSLEEMMKNFKGNVESGELCVKEKSNNRAVSLANTAVWTAK